MDDKVRELLKFRKDIESSFLKIKDSDPGKARFYSLMLSEIDDRIGFYRNVASQRNHNKIIEKQSRINKNVDFLARFIIFISLAQLAVLLALILLIV